MTLRFDQVGSASRAISRGFTIVELVMTLVILGILSASAMALFSSRSGYSAFLAKDQFIAAALQTQQIALALESSATPSSLTVELDSGNWVFTVNKETVPITVLSADAAGGSLTINGATLTSPQTFSYNRSGSLTNNTNYTLVFTAGNSHTVCLAASGYAYSPASGNCL